MTSNKYTLVVSLGELELISVALNQLSAYDRSKSSLKSLSPALQLHFLAHLLEKIEGVIQDKHEERLQVKDIR